MRWVGGLDRKEIGVYCELLSVSVDCVLILQDIVAILAQFVVCLHSTVCIIILISYTSHSFNVYRTLTLVYFGGLAMETVITSSAYIELPT